MTLAMVVTFLLSCPNKCGFAYRLHWKGSTHVYLHNLCSTLLVRRVKEKGLKQVLRGSSNNLSGFHPFFPTHMDVLSSDWIVRMETEPFIINGIQYIFNEDRVMMPEGSETFEFVDGTLI